MAKRGTPPVGPAESSGKGRRSAGTARRTYWNEAEGVRALESVQKTILVGLVRAFLKYLPLGIEVVRRGNRIVRLQPRLAGEGVVPANAQDMLRDGGFDTATRPASESGAVTRATRQYQALMASGLSTSQAAHRLGVNESRIRQRLGGAHPDLYGIKVNGSWLVPAFQFRDQGTLVPNLERVIPALPRDLHPLGVLSWFTTPNPDLDEAPGLDAPISPRDWLCAGFDPEVVTELARHVDA